MRTSTSGGKSWSGILANLFGLFMDEVVNPPAESGGLTDLFICIELAEQMRRVSREAALVIQSSHRNSYSRQLRTSLHSILSIPLAKQGTSGRTLTFSASRFTHVPFRLEETDACARQQQ